MASQEYPLHEILIGTEAFILSRPANSGSKLAFSSDTGVLFFLDGTEWYEFTGGATMIASSSSSNSSSASSKSSESSKSSSSQSSSSKSSSSQSSSSKSSSSKSSASSSSSAKREIYPEVITHETTLTALNTEIDIYTAVKLQATIRQIYDINVSNLDLELVGLFFYNGTSTELTTPGSYTPLRGSFATSEDPGQEPNFYMAPETGFIAELEADPYEITITDKNYQTISFDKIDTDYVLNGSKVLAATASSGLPITYTSSDPTIASVSGSTLTYAGASGGTVTITASQPGNADFDPATDVSRTFIIRPPYCVKLPGAGVSGTKGINMPYSAIQEGVDYTMMWWMWLGDPSSANNPTKSVGIFTDTQGANYTHVGYDGQLTSVRIGSASSPTGHFYDEYTVPFDTWCHLAITRDNETVTHYLDGVQVFQSTTPNNLAPLGRNQYGVATDEANQGASIGPRLGPYSTTETWPFSSYYNDWAVWDGRFLTAGEVAAIHADGVQHINPPTVIMGTKNGPDSYFRMGDDDFPQSKLIRNVGNRPAPQRATSVGPGGESTADFAQLLDQAEIIPLAEV